MGTSPAKSLDFADFTPDDPNDVTADVLDRATLKGLTPEETAQRLISFWAKRVRHRDITRHQKEMVLKQVFAALAKKKIDAPNMTPEIILVYREYLAKLVLNGDISESYASHIAKVWNSVVRCAFGEDGKPGEGLIMRGFPMRVRKIQRYDEDEMNLLRSATARHKFRSELDKDAFEAYQEINFCAGNRIGSLVYVVKGKIEHEATFANIDWEMGIIRFPHMKNQDEDEEPHEAVLSERALARLKQRVEFLRAKGLWKGDETPILLGSSGKSLTPQGINKTLKAIAASAGILKPISTHVVRKSVGTHIGRQNPRYAAEQLGISMEVFEKNYNQPTIEDRITRRDLLPGGSEWTPKTPEEMVGHAWLQKSRGLISDDEFKAILQRAEQLRALPASKVPETSPYV